MGLPPKLRSLLVPIHKNIECGKCKCGAFVDIGRVWIPRIMVGARNGVAAVRVIVIVVGKNPAEFLFDAMVSWGEHCHLESVLGRHRFVGTGGRRACVRLEF
jgi:hypothetical protein